MTAGSPTHLWAMTKIAELPARGVVVVEGTDRVAFLNGLVSNDVAKVEPGRAVWAALLTAQGKWLADFFVFTDGDRLLLDCERAQAEMLVTRLGRYRLRADARLADASDTTTVFAAWDGTPVTTGAVAAPDPRLPDAGWRIIGSITANATADDYDAHRLSLGLPDGSRDMESEKSVLLEGGFDELGGIDWEKGCWMGQELTARTRYRGLLKRRLMPVTGMLPEPGTPVLANGAEVGAIRSVAGEQGLALLRLDALDKSLLAGGTTITVGRPDWVRLPG